MKPHCEPLLCRSPTLRRAVAGNDCCTTGVSWEYALDLILTTELILLYTLFMASEQDTPDSVQDSRMCMEGA